MKSKFFTSNNLDEKEFWIFTAIFTTIIGVAVWFLSGGHVWGTLGSVVFAMGISAATQIRMEKDANAHQRHVNRLMHMHGLTKKEAKMVINHCRTEFGLFYDNRRTCETTTAEAIVRRRKGGNTTDSGQTAGKGSSD